jgi:hypothetical protein
MERWMVARRQQKGVGGSRRLAFLQPAKPMLDRGPHIRRRFGHRVNIRARRFSEPTQLRCARPRYDDDALDAAVA